MQTHVFNIAKQHKKSSDAKTKTANPKIASNLLLVEVITSKEKKKKMAPIKTSTSRTTPHRAIMSVSECLNARMQKKHIESNMIKY